MIQGASASVGLPMPMNEYCASSPSISLIHHLFEVRVNQCSEAIALQAYEKLASSAHGELLTYRVLNDRANQLAHFLQSHGVKPDTPVGLCVDRSFDLVISVLAILKAGGAYLPLDPSYPAERLHYMLENAQAPLLLTQSHLLPHLPVDTVPTICLDTEAQTIAQHSTANPTSDVEAGHLAYVIYTSGSTGRPKAVAMPHAPLVNLIQWQQQSSVAAGAKTLQFTPISFDVSFQEIFSTLTTGGTLVLISDTRRRDPRELLRCLNQAQIARLFLPFVALQHLADTICDTGTLPTHLREVITAGEQLRITPAIARWFDQMPDCTLHNHYGPSETHVVTAYTMQGAPSEWELLPPIGRAIANTEIYLLDPQLQPVPEGAAGELYIGGVCLAREYLNRPDLTQQRFIPNPLTPASKERLYKTGDLACYLPDGNLKYLGRADQQVKIRGFRVELGEIEAVLEQHPAVQEAVVIAREGDLRQRLIAYVIVAPALTENDIRKLPKQLRQFLKMQLPDYMLPHSMMVLDQFPLTPSGKVDRLHLPIPHYQPEVESLTLPRTTTETILAQIWADVLGLQQIGIDDDFLELGGHSLLATQMMSRIRDAFGVELSLRCLFDAPTVRQLAETIVAQHSDTALPRLESAPRGTDLPLAYVQEPLWLLDQLMPNHPFYSVPEAFRIEGPLDVQALEQSFQAIVDRHEAVRTNFWIVDGKPVQVIRPSVSFHLNVVDLEPQAIATSLPITQQETELGRLILEESRRSFDLTQDLLLRATLFSMSNTEHVLFINLHHIVCDGWSLSILLHELSTVYQNDVFHTSIALPALKIQYADFALWNRQWLQDDIREQQLAYWKQKLAGLPPMLQLPTDYARPLTTCYRGARHFLSLSHQMSERLKQLSHHEETTLFMTLLGAFQTLLFHYSGQDDIAIGSLLANRHHPELESLIGFFANMIVLRTDLSGQPTFRELLQRVRETTLEAYAHQDLTFEQLVRSLQPDRDLNQNPLVQVVFNLQNTRTSAWGIPGVALTQLAIDNQTVKFDLFLELTETPSGLTGYFEYSTDLFQADTIARLVEHFQILLDKIAANPDQKLSEFSLLTPTEQQQLHTWNQTQTDILSACIHQLFEAQVERTPDAIAIEFEGRSLTYRELNQRSNQLAHYLQALGVKPETLVGICVERSLEMVIGLFGILKAGGAYVPLDPAYPQERLAFMLEDSEVPVLLTQYGLVEKLPTHTAKVVCLDTHWEKIAIASQKNLDSSVTPNHLAYTIYTSGSTGKPKGVQIEHRALTNFLHSMRQQPGLTAQDVLLAVTTISFDIAALELYLPLIVGARLVLVSREVASNAAQLSQALQQSGVTVMQATPATWRLLLAGGWQGDRRLKLLCGGEALPRELANQLLQKCQSLWNMYGPTETTIWSALHAVESGDGPVVVGRAIANTQIYILNSHAHNVFNPVPIGVMGEVFIGGDGLARGYLNCPDLTTERFIWGQLNGATTRLYKTGDLGRYRPDGTLEILGRVDHQVKIRGFRIELGDIEATLNQHSSIREAVVVAREDQPGDKRLVAYVVPKSERELTASNPTATQSTLQAEQLQQWQAIYNEAYSRTSSTDIADPTFNIGIWISSYTGLPYGIEAMQEWVDRTVDRILSLQPNRVLEIGCGTGLLLFRIAPHCQDYLGCDLSEAAIHYVEQQLQRNPEQYSHVKLATRSADSLGDIEPGTVDTIVLNSVIQYFPDVDYLVRVLETAVKLVKSGGSIFIGDVRCLSLLETFHTSVQLYQADDELLITQIQQLVRDNVAQETELLIDPAFFTALKHHLPTISHVEVQLKRGHHQNEMTRFRYDVILHVDSEKSTTYVNPHIWDATWAPAAIRQALQEHQPDVFALTQVKNGRIAADVEAMRMLTTLEESGTVAGLRTVLSNSALLGVDPELLWNLGQELDYHVSITWSEQVDCFDVVFQRSPTPIVQLKPTSADLSVRPWHFYSNNPLQNHQTHQLVQQLRSHLKEKLPEFMLPSAIVLMEALPQTPNGKVDRNALPAPHRESLNLKDFAAPRSDTEKQLATIWEQVLGVPRAGIHDNFFDLGGHSLLAAQVLAQIQRVFRIEFSLINLFLAPTIGQLAPLIEQRTASTPTALQPVPLDLRAEVVLDPAIRANGAIAPTAQPANVLLTGASGFLGAFLLHELLQQTSANVYCLVRASDAETARQRLQRNLEHYSLWRSEQSDRIIPVVGDLSKPYLGLAQETFQRLSATIDSIYHNGGLVNFIYPYPVLKAANVLGTEEVLRLAGQTRTKSVHFISSVGVFSPIAYEHGQVICSQDQPERVEGLYGYTQSKWVAEQLIHLAQARGIPAAIYRPAWIEGHSQTGICNRADFVRSLIKGCIQMGFAPDWNMPMDIAPVDYISRAIVHLSQKTTSLGDAFNFSNPRSLMWTQLVEWMVQFGYSVKTVPYPQWLTAVRDQAQHSDHPLHAFLPFLTEPLSGYSLSVPEIYFQTNAIHFDTQNIQMGLADIHLVCPPLDDPLLTTYFSYFIRSKFLPPPPASVSLN